MNRRRLKSLANGLKRVVPGHFNLFSFIEGDDETPLTPGSVERQLKDPNCDTTACAVGWLPVLFPRTWMYTQEEGFVSIQLRNGNDIPKDGAYSIDYTHSLHYYGLTESEWRYLFDYSYYRFSDKKNPEKVIEHIENLLDGLDVDTIGMLS